jgi:hypothetical protein
MSEPLTYGGRGIYTDCPAQSPEGLMQPAVPHCERRFSGSISAPCCIWHIGKAYRERRTPLLRLTYIGASGAGYDKGLEGA